MELTYAEVSMNRLSLAGCKCRSRRWLGVVEVESQDEDNRQEAARVLGANDVADQMPPAAAARSSTNTGKKLSLPADELHRLTRRSLVIDSCMARWRWSIQSVNKEQSSWTSAAIRARHLPPADSKMGTPLFKMI